MKYLMIRSLGTGLVSHKTSELLVHTVLPEVYILPALSWRVFPGTAPAAQHTSLCAVRNQALPDRRCGQQSCSGTAESPRVTYPLTFPWLISSRPERLPDLNVSAIRSPIKHWPSAICAPDTNIQNSLNLSALSPKSGFPHLNFPLRIVRSNQKMRMPCKHRI
jgi:hypothetical protein